MGVCNAGKGLLRVLLIHAPTAMYHKCPVLQQLLALQLNYFLASPLLLAFWTFEKGLYLDPSFCVLQSLSQVLKDHEECLL